MTIPRTTPRVTPQPAAWELRPPDSAVPDASSRLFDYAVLRLTGLVLAILVLGHFAVTHVVTDVANDNSAFVTRRLSSVVWIAWDGTMLAAALVHGAVGIRLAVSDYATAPRVRRTLERAVAAVAIVVFVLGLIVIGRAAHV